MIILKYNIHRDILTYSCHINRKTFCKSGILGQVGSPDHIS